MSITSKKISGNEKMNMLLESYKANLIKELEKNPNLKHFTDAELSGYWEAIELIKQT